MSSKNIETLIHDIEQLLEGKLPLTDDLEQVIMDGCLALGWGLLGRLKARREFAVSPATQGETQEAFSPPFRLRPSNLGNPPRKLWYEAHGRPRAPFPQGIALIGEVIEHLVLILARASGHEVKHVQERVEVPGGLDGSIDAVIDGQLVDVKSSSSYGMNKFREGLNDDNDTYGYRRQISAYAAALGLDKAYFFAVDKQNLDMVLSETGVFADEEEFIHELGQMLESPEPPERCYSDKLKAKTSENRVLGTGCKFCDFKWECWSDANEGEGLRAFDYSAGPEYFTHVADIPTSTRGGKKNEIEEITEKLRPE